jgi:arylformamidase
MSSVSGGDWIDASVAIEDPMPTWPGDPPVRVVAASRIADGADANVSRLDMGAHTGTHVDAPHHFIDGAATVDTMPPSVMVGPGRVVTVDELAIGAAAIGALAIQAGERVLFKTRNSPAAWRLGRFDEEAAHFTADAARALAAARPALVGIDYLSVGGYRDADGPEVHRLLLGAGIWIVEGLDLTAVPPGPCDVACLPLRVARADGAPARVLVRPR